MRREPRYIRRRRTAFAIAAVTAAAAVAAIVAAGSGGTTPKAPATTPARTVRSRTTTTHTPPTRGPKGTESVPILMYHVILPAPPGAPFPGLYVPRPEFAAQMHALAAAGYHAVTMNEMWDNWHRGAPLPAGKPI